MNPLACAIAIDTKALLLLTFLTMPKASIRKNPPGLSIRELTEDQYFKIKMAAFVEKKTVRQWLLDLADTRIRDLTKKGLLPKGK